MSFKVKKQMIIETIEDIMKIGSDITMSSEGQILQLRFNHIIPKKEDIDRILSKHNLNSIWALYYNNINEISGFKITIPNFELKKQELLSNYLLDLKKYLL